MRSPGAASILTWAVLSAGCWLANAAPAMAEQPSLWAGVEQKTRPIQFHRIVVGVPRGDQIGTISGGVFCTGRKKVHYNGRNLSFDNRAFAQVFDQELSAAGFAVVGGSDSLFKDPRSEAPELLVAGRVSRAWAKACMKLIRWRDYSTAKGEGELTVDWEVYGALERRVLYKVRTTGRGKLGDSQGDGVHTIFTLAFTDAARNLIADPKFRELAMRQAPATQPTATVAPATIAALPLFEGSIVDQMIDVRLGVVTVFAGGGHGSGFFIDDAGHMLTNAHVVKGAHRVRIKLSTGREINGQVLSVDPARDAALVKVNTRGILGLPLRLDPAPVGSDVYAVGSPLDENLDTTVSRGVVSAYRDRNGLSFVQSDVTIQPGNSGGPLLDASGNVIGMTVMSRLTDSGELAGINFFAPIGDIVERLHLELKPLATN
jgi:serine protease Do